MANNSIYPSILRNGFLVFLAIIATLIPKASWALGDFGGSSLSPADLGVGPSNPLPVLPPRLYVNSPAEYQRILGLHNNGDFFYKNMQILRGFDSATGRPAHVFPLRLNAATGGYEPDFYSSLGLGGGTFFFDNAAQADAITQYFALVQGAGVVSRGIGMATGSGGALPMEGLMLGQVPRILTTAAPVPVAGVPGALMAGQAFEAEQLGMLGLGKNNLLFRPTLAETQSAAFNVIVGDAQFTQSGALRGTIFDSINSAGLLEIKGGSSILNSSYQLRLQTFYSLKNGIPFSIYTTRPINPQFMQWLQRWGVNVGGPVP